MSGIIFVLLAIGWAVYLLPKALKRNDELDQRQPVEEFSHAVRVLGRGVASKVASVTAPASVEPESAAAPEAAPEPAVAVHTVTRAAARRAAQRRRRVLALLLTTLVAVTVTSYLAYTPWYSTAIPGGLIVAFLIIARLTVRKQQVRVSVPVAARAEVVAEATEASVEEADAGQLVDLDREDTQGLSREALAAAVAEAAEPVLDEGALWDPLPVTLPTYVNKARARRTVRTIEITAATTGVTSSGHNAADSAIAAEAREAEQQAAIEGLEVPGEAKKAAGA